MFVVLGFQFQAFAGQKCAKVGQEAKLQQATKEYHLEISALYSQYEAVYAKMAELQKSATVNTMPADKANAKVLEVIQNLEAEARLLMDEVDTIRKNFLFLYEELTYSC